MNDHERHKRYREMYLMKVIHTQIGKILPDPAVKMMGHDYQVAIPCYNFLNF
jgi:hypothetical protein